MILAAAAVNTCLLHLGPQPEGLNLPGDPSRALTAIFCIIYTTNCNRRRITIMKWWTTTTWGAVLGSHSMRKVTERYNNWTPFPAYSGRVRRSTFIHRKCLICLILIVFLRASQVDDQKASQETMIRASLGVTSLSWSRQFWENIQVGICSLHMKGESVK